MPEPIANENPLTLADCVCLVSEFHHQIKAPVCARTPQLLSSDLARASIFSQRLADLSREMADAASGIQDQLLGRAAMAVEELGEWVEAHTKVDLVAAADALADRFYVLVGDTVSTGLPLDLLFLEVHRSNLSKLAHVQTGHGKGAKGPGYVRPDITKVLRDYARINSL